MDVLSVECLNCGRHYRLEREDERHLRGGECPRCGYLGWAPPAHLSERVRLLLRERRVGATPLRPVA